MTRFLPFSAAVLVMALLLVQQSDGQVNIKLPQVEPVKHQAYTETIKGIDRESKAEMTASFDMVPIPGGVYLMGSPDSEPGRTAQEGPQHPVRIRPFYMAQDRGDLGRVRRLVEGTRRHRGRRERR